MKSAPFSFVQPSSISEAVATLEESNGAGKILAGGMSLLPLMAFRLIRPALLVDITRLPGLSDIFVDSSSATIGALATHRTVETDLGLGRVLPIVSEALGHLGHVSIRNVGTVGGSLAHADPAAEWPALGLVLDGSVEIAGLDGAVRECRVDELIRDWMDVNLKPFEIITSLRLEIPSSGSGWGFQELARRRGDFAICGVAATVSTIDGIVSRSRVAMLGAGLTPLRAVSVESALLGRPVESPHTLPDVAAAVQDDISPLDDEMATADYRRKLAQVLVERVLAQAVKRT